MPQDSTERLQKVLAHAGVASRRKAEEMIQEGRVMVNGQVVTELGTKVDPRRDDIRVDGERLKPAEPHVYLVLNKPKGVLSTMDDERGRRALGDLVSPGLTARTGSPTRLYPVGRLDVNSEGLILLTDDGELANLLTHPRYEHEKEYRVLVNGYPSEKTLDAWQRGLILEGQRTAPAQVGVIRRDKDGTWLRIVMHEGRKRQIRDVAALLGHPVRELSRVRLGPLQLGTLEPGQFRPPTPAELQALQEIKRSAGQPRRKATHTRTKARGEAPGTQRERRPRTPRAGRGGPKGSEGKRESSGGERERRPSRPGARREGPQGSPAGRKDRREGPKGDTGREDRREGPKGERERRPARREDKREAPKARRKGPPDRPGRRGPKS